MTRRYEVVWGAEPPWRPGGGGISGRAGVQGKKAAGVGDGKQGGTLRHAHPRGRDGKRLAWKRVKGGCAP